MRQKIKLLILAGLSVLISCECKTNKKVSMPCYDRADILYSGCAPWGIIRFASPTTEDVLINFRDYKKTYIDDIDTLRYIYDHAPD